MPSKEYQQFYKALIAHSSSQQLPLDESRKLFDALIGQYPPEPDISFEYFLINKLPACWAAAPGASRNHVVLFFHAGAFNSGTVNAHRNIMGRLSRAAGCAVLAIDYRLAPEHPFPAALEDATTAYQWLLKKLPSSSVILVGCSAGGGLALSLCLELKSKQQPQPPAAVCISPWVDLTCSFPSIEINESKDWVKGWRLRTAARDYAAKQPLTNPLISPYYGDLHGLPPLMILTGGFDVLHDEVTAFAKKAQGSGVDVTFEDAPGMVHGWPYFAAQIPEGQQAINAIGAFIKSFF